MYPPLVRFLGGCAQRATKKKPPRRSHKIAPDQRLQKSQLMSEKNQYHESAIFLKRFWCFKIWLPNLMAKIDQKNQFLWDYSIFETIVLESNYFTAPLNAKSCNNRVNLVVSPKQLFKNQKDEFLIL